MTEVGVQKLGRLSANFEIMSVIKHRLLVDHLFGLLEWQLE